MGKYHRCVFARSLTFLTVATLLVTGIKAPIMADKDPQQIYIEILRDANLQAPVSSTQPEVNIAELWQAALNVKFDGANHLLDNLRPALVYSTNGGETWTSPSDTAVVLSVEEINQAVSYKGILVKAVYNGVQSDVLKIDIDRAAQPVGVYASPAADGTGSIMGVATDMQYRMEGSEIWNDVSDSVVSNLPKGKYFVRRKASGYSVESMDVEVVVGDEIIIRKEATPTAMFNAYNMNLDGVSGCRVSLDGGKTWSDGIKDSTYVVDETKLSDKDGILIFRIGNNVTTSDSDCQHIALARQPEPDNVTVLNATASVPGCLVGTDNSMQYRPQDQDEWIDITGNTIPVAIGSYMIRRHGFSNALPSEPMLVVVKAATEVTPTSPTKVTPITKVDENNSSEVKPVKEDKKPVEKPSDTKDKVVEDKIIEINNVDKKQDKDKKKDDKKESDDIVVDNPFADNDKGPILSSGESGWNALMKKLDEAPGSIVMNLNEDTKIPCNVFLKAAEMGTELVIATGNAVWRVLPEDINVKTVSDIAKINLGIEEDSPSIPVEALASLEDISKNQIINKAFDIMHDGKFGFVAELKIKLDDVTPSDYANLFCYNKFENKIEYISSSEIDENSEATFTMNHASSYVIVVSKEAMSQANVKDVVLKKTTEEKAEQIADSNNAATPEVNSFKIALLTISIAVLVVCIAILCLRRKYGSEIFK